MVCTTITIAATQVGAGIVYDTSGFLKSDGTQISPCLSATGIIGTAVTIETVVRVTGATAKFNLRYEYTTNGVQSSVTSAQYTQVISDWKYVLSFDENYVAGATYTDLVVSVIDVIAA